MGRGRGVGQTSLGKVGNSALFNWRDPKEAVTENLATRVSRKHVNMMYKEFFFKTGFHALCYISTMPRLVQIETCFFWDNSLNVCTFCASQIKI